MTTMSDYKFNKKRYQKLHSERSDVSEYQQKQNNAFSDVQRAYQQTQCKNQRSLDYLQKNFLDDCTNYYFIVDRFYQELWQLLFL